MALLTSRSTQLTGSSKFDEGTAMMFNATIRSDNGSSLNASIVNQSIYNDHKNEVQKDLAEFNAEVFSLTSEIDTTSSDSKEK